MDNVFAQPDVKAIKKRIEDLISRDYLERDKDNANLFKYLAWCDLDDFTTEVVTAVSKTRQGWYLNQRISVTLNFLEGRSYKCL